jgi:type IV secretory pathway VirB10-like protein
MSGENYKKAFGSGAKGRTNFLVVGILAVIVAAGAALVTKKNTAGSGGAAATVMTAPDGRADVSPDKATEAYLQTLREANKNETAKAEKQGGSAVAVLTNKTTKVDEKTEAVPAGATQPVILSAPTAPLPQFVPPQGQSMAMGQQGPQYSSSQPAQPPEPRKNPALTAQVNELLNTWSAPGQSIYVAQVTQPAQAATSSAQAAADAAAAEGCCAEPVVLVPAGQILSAVIQTEAVSDDNGPVLALVVSGPYKGARLLGSMRVGVEKMVIQFNQMTFKGKSMPVTAIAVDPSTARAGLADEVDKRWFQKYGLLFLSSFVGGYGEAAAQVDEVQVQGANGTTVSKSKLSSGDRAVVALGKSGSAVAQQMAQVAQSVQTMVKVNQGSPVGILFLSDLTVAK